MGWTAVSVNILADPYHPTWVRALKSVEILGIAVPIIIVSIATKRVPSQRLSKISLDRQEVGYLGVEYRVVAASSGAPISISSV